jgi:hypothetical protein
VKRQPSKMFQATYRIGHLILQLFGSQPGDDFLLVNDRSHNLLQLSPPLGHDLTWPPRFVFGDETYERFSTVAFPES